MDAVDTSEGICERSCALMVSSSESGIVGSIPVF